MPAPPHFPSTILNLYTERWGEEKEDTGEEGKEHAADVSASAKEEMSVGERPKKLNTRAQAFPRNHTATSPQNAPTLLSEIAHESASAKGAPGRPRALSLPGVPPPTRPNPESFTLTLDMGQLAGAGLSTH